MEVDCTGFHSVVKRCRLIYDGRESRSFYNLRTTQAGMPVLRGMVFHEVVGDHVAHDQVGIFDSAHVRHCYLNAELG
jgi:hypothetical protein